MGWVGDCISSGWGRVCGRKVFVGFGVGCTVAFNQGEIVTMEGWNGTGRVWGWNW